MTNSYRTAEPTAPRGDNLIPTPNKPVLLLCQHHASSLHTNHHCAPHRRRARLPRLPAGNHGQRSRRVNASWLHERKGEHASAQGREAALV